VSQDVLDEYISDVAKVVNADLKGLKVVYSPLHGTGAKFVPKVLKMLGAEVIEVTEQMVHNGNFPTVKTPNPEDDRALELLNWIPSKCRLWMAVLCILSVCSKR